MLNNLPALLSIFFKKTYPAKGLAPGTGPSPVSRNTNMETCWSATGAPVKECAEGIEGA